MADLPTRYGQAPSHDDVSRALSSIRKDFQGTKVAYTPGEASDWADPPPTTIAEALDRLAAVAASPP